MPDCLGQVDQATEVFGIVELTQSRSVALSHARVLWVNLTADCLQRRNLFGRRLDPVFGNLQRGQRKIVEMPPEF